MFRLIEPLSGQNHSTHSMNALLLWLWPDDGSMSRNMSPNF